MISQNVPSASVHRLTTCDTSVLYPHIGNALCRLCLQQPLLRVCCCCSFLNKTVLRHGWCCSARLPEGSGTPGEISASFFLTSKNALTLSPWKVRRFLVSFIFFSLQDAPGVRLCQSWIYKQI